MLQWSSLNYWLLSNRFSIQHIHTGKESERERREWTKAIWQLAVQRNENDFKLKSHDNFDNNRLNDSQMHSYSMCGWNSIVRYKILNPGIIFCWTESALQLSIVLNILKFISFPCRSCACISYVSGFHFKIVITVLVGFLLMYSSIN